MAGAPLSIKLRCASWQQLSTIYRRDLTRGSMFLKASTQPAIGTIVKIDLELPSGTVIELQGKIANHTTDPQRGTGVDLQLDPLPTKSVWMIESALAAENKVRAQSGTEVTVPAPSTTTTALSDGQDIAAAEVELIKALEAEVDSLRELNPFLVLGLGYESSDADVRHAFGELTKRYHPDRFMRYQSPRLRQLAAEIFILIRDAYRKLADDKSRQQVIATIGVKATPKAAPQRVTPPRGSPSPAAIAQRIPTLNKLIKGSVEIAEPNEPKLDDPPTSPSAKSAQLAHTELAQRDSMAIAIEPVPPAPLPAARVNPNITVPMPTTKVDVVTSGGGLDTSNLEAQIEDGKVDEALAGFRMLAKRHPNDTTIRAGIELCEGLKALVEKDRMEAAQRFEAALELDPSNERAARELAEMRRQATNERKGLLSRLMGKKETP